ncbi:MAG: DUF1667 domain-containing protein [Erysipelotrichaceae bacterium]|nr:DUF1667 domain-containing protein [Erysipelotrichaceae bacterium]
MKSFICIECPKGCHLTIDENFNVTGNSCIRGKNYAINEIKCPKRILTSTVKLTNASISRLPVITSAPIPKDKMFDVIKEIHKVSISAPVKLHDIIISNVCNLSIDIIATRTINKN